MGSLTLKYARATQPFLKFDRRHRPLKKPRQDGLKISHTGSLHISLIGENKLMGWVNGEITHQGSPKVSTFLKLKLQ